MPSTPLLVGLQVQQPSGTNRSNIQVTCSNESTSQSTTKNTDATDAKVLFNLGSTVDFSKGWNVGDKVSVFSLYLGFEQHFSFTIPAFGTSISIKDNSNVVVGSFTGGMGMSNGVLVLVAVSASPSLRYFTTQEWFDYFNMNTKDVDAENGIEVLRLIRIGRAVETLIDSETNSKFDSNSGSYYAPTDIDENESPEYIDARFPRQNNYYLKFTPVNELINFETSQNIEGTNDITWKELVHNQIDAMEATTGWAATTDGSVTLNSTPSQVSEADACLNLVKSGSTVAAVTYSKTFSTQYRFNNRPIKVDYYINAATDLAATDAIALRFGNDSSNYYEQTWDRNQLSSAAWNTLSFKKDDTGVTVTGNPDTAAFDFFAIVVTTTASSTTIASPDQRLDDLRLNDKNLINLDKNTGRIRITDSDNYAEQGKRHARATYNFGRTTIPQDIKMLAIMETGTRLLGFNFMQNQLRDFGDLSMPDMNHFMAVKDKIINKYKNIRIYST